MKRKQTKHKWIYSALIALSIFSVMCLCCCSIGFVGFIGQKETDRTKQYMMDVTQKSAIAVNDKISGYISSLRAIAVAISGNASTTGDDAQLLRNVLELQEFSRIGYVFSDGDSYIIDRSQGELSGVDFREKAYVQGALSGGTVVTDPFNDHWTGRSIVIISVPIYNQNHAVTGALCGVNSVELFAKALEESTSESNAYFHIVDADGNMILRSSFADEDTFSPNIFTAEYEYTGDFEQVKADFAQGKSGLTGFKEQGKEEKYVAYVPIDVNNWYVASIMKTSTVEKQTQEIMLFAGAMMVMLAITIVLLAVTAVTIQRKEKEVKFELAFQDKLAGCNNKAKFILDLQTRGDLYDGQHAVVVYDIQNFSAYNKIFSFSNGDELIAAIGRTLRSEMREGEFFARSYADRFLLLLRVTSQAGIDQRLGAVFARLNAHLDANGQSGYALVSRCGVYHIQPQDKLLAPDTFIDRANQARASLGEVYKSSVCYFDAAKTNLLDEAAMLEAHMHTALEQCEFLVYLQPKYAIQGEAPVLCGAESLVRWLYQGKTLIPPDRFIPKFEQNGFILELDMYMLEQSCILLRKWLDAGLRCVPLSVNQSRLHMFNPSYRSKILEITQKYQIPHALLEFEITESAMMSDAGRVQEQFRQLRQLGFATSMDDFGSGFSSLHMLKDLEADTIKIDKGFFSQSFHSDNGKYIVRTTIALAKGLGYQVLAEGIETAEQVQFLQECGCDLVQGYYFAKPQPCAEFEKRLTEL